MKHKSYGSLVLPPISLRRSNMEKETDEFYNKKILNKEYVFYKKVKMVDYSFVPLGKSIREGQLRINSVSYFSPQLEKFIKGFIKSECKKSVNDETQISNKLCDVKEQNFKEFTTYYNSKYYSIKFLKTLKPKPIKKPIQLKPTIAEVKEDCQQHIIEPMNSNIQELETYNGKGDIRRIQESARTRYEKSMKRTVPFFYKKSDVIKNEEKCVCNYEDEMDVVRVVMNIDIQGIR